MASPKDEKVVQTAEEKPAETSAEETSAQESSTEEKTASKEVPEAPVAPEKAEKPTEEQEFSEEEKQKLSVKAQKRFSELSKKAKRTDELEKELEQLRLQQEGQFTAGLKPEAGAVSPSPQAPKLPWEDQQGTQEVTVDDYKRDVLSTADWLVQARLNQVRQIDDKVDEIKNDLGKVQQKWEKLNPDSDNYDKGLSTNLAELYNNQLKANPKVKLYDFVETIMGIHEKGKEEGTQATSASVVKQKSEEALTPSEAEMETAQKPFEEMNLDEKEKYLKDHGLWE